MAHHVTRPSHNPVDRRVLHGAFSRLEPCAVKVASTVLRGRGDRKVALLPDENTLRVRFSSAGVGLTSVCGRFEAGFGMAFGPQSGALFSILSDTVSVWTEVDTQGKSLRSPSISATRSFSTSLKRSPAP